MQVVRYLLAWAATSCCAGFAEMHRPGITPETSASRAGGSESPGRVLPTPWYIRGVVIFLPCCVPRRPRHPPAGAHLLHTGDLPVHVLF